MKHTTKAAAAVSVVSENVGAAVFLTIKRPDLSDATVKLHPAEAEAIGWALMHQAQAADMHTETPAAMLVAARDGHVVTARAI